MKSEFFAEVSRLATAQGFEEKGVERGLLQLHLDGELAAQVDESGSMLYHPHKKVFALIDQVDEARDRIAKVQYAEGNEPAEQETQMGQKFC